MLIKRSLAEQIVAAGFTGVQWCELADYRSQV